jgi:hypothetical protein
LDCHQTPISLIPEDGSDIPVVPLPVFSTAAPAAEENKAADATAEENHVFAIYIFDDFIRFFRNI